MNNIDRCLWKKRSIEILLIELLFVSDRSCESFEMIFLDSWSMMKSIEKRHYFFRKSLAMVTIERVSFDWIHWLSIVLTQQFHWSNLSTDEVLHKFQVTMNNLVNDFYLRRFLWSCWRLDRSVESKKINILQLIKDLSMKIDMNVLI